MTTTDIIQDKIITKIRRNRISTTQVADCLGKTGAIPDVRPLRQSTFAVGPVFLAYAYNESNWELHEQIQDVAPGDIVLVETDQCNDRAIFGELVAKYLALYRGAAAIVVNGHVRDANHILKEQYPVWCKGATPIGCFNRPNNEPIDSVVLGKWKEAYQGAVAVCDDSGVVVIPPDRITESFLDNLDFIELQEDIWFYYLDTKKMSTYETVCLKKYREDEDLPLPLRDPFERLERDLESS